MRLYRVFVSENAKKSLENIYDYISIELSSITNAENTIKKLDEFINSLGFMPEKFKLIDISPYREMGYRSNTVGNYLVIYRVSKEQKAVYVLDVFYCKADIKNILEKM